MFTNEHIYSVNVVSQNYVYKWCIDFVTLITLFRCTLNHNVRIFGCFVKLTDVLNVTDEYRWQIESIFMVLPITVIFGKHRISYYDTIIVRNYGNKRCYNFSDTAIRCPLRTLFVNTLMFPFIVCLSLHESDCVV